MGILSRELEVYRQLSKSYFVQIVTYGDRKDHDFGLFTCGLSILPLHRFNARSSSRLLNFLYRMIALSRYSSVISRSNIIRTHQVSGALLAILARSIFALNARLVIRGGYDLYLGRAETASRLSPRRFLIYALSKFSYRCADAIIISTEELKRAIVRCYRVPNERIVVIPNFIDSQIFFFKKKRKARHTPHSQARVLFVGRFEKEKQLDILVTALSKSGIGLTIIGSGSEKCRLLCQAKRLDVDLQIIETLPNTELPQYYWTHDVFVLCSRFEGNPKCLIEAMACGTPVVGTNVEGINNIIVDGVTGILVRPTPLDLLDGIRLAISGSPKIGGIVKNAARSVAEKNTIVRCLRLELNLYYTLFKTGFDR